MGSPGRRVEPGAGTVGTAGSEAVVDCSQVAGTRLV